MILLLLSLCFALPFVGGIVIFLRAGRPLQFALVRSAWMALYAAIPVTLFAIVSAAVNQFAGINIFPAVPIVVLLFFAWVSTLRGNVPLQQQANPNITPSLAEAQQLAKAYGEVLGRATSIIRSEGDLPASKERIKDALIVLARNTKSLELLESLRLGYASLADFVPYEEAAAANHLDSLVASASRSDIDRAELIAIAELMATTGAPNAERRSVEEFARLAAEFEERVCG